MKQPNKTLDKKLYFPLIYRFIQNESTNSWRTLDIYEILEKHVMFVLSYSTDEFTVGGAFGRGVGDFIFVATNGSGASKILNMHYTSHHDVASFDLLRHNTPASGDIVQLSIWPKVYDFKIYDMSDWFL